MSHLISLENRLKKNIPLNFAVVGINLAFHFLKCNEMRGKNFTVVLDRIKLYSCHFLFI